MSTEFQLRQRFELVESAMNRYLAPMPCYWISMDIVMLSVQEQCFINVL